MFPLSLSEIVYWFPRILDKLPLEILLSQIIPNEYAKLNHEVQAILCRF
jgi:hypothetical protein